MPDPAPGAYPHPVRHISEIAQQDLANASSEVQDRELAAFETRLRVWSGHMEQVREGGDPTISVETPVFKGGWLMPCIESVLYQTSTRWNFCARWDGGDELSRRILEIVDRVGHTKVGIHFGENRGIAYTRRYLSEHSSGEYIVSLDDDDMLAPDLVEQFLSFVKQKPWSGIVRAKRDFIDEVGNPVESDPWFPFEPRCYRYGMVSDIFNHSQPALISRWAYDRTTGWEGFEEFMFAGADCDIFTKIEEVAPIELMEPVLYYYRLSDRRTSLVIKDEAAFEMWRRLADKTIARIGLPLRRANDTPPFEYERVPQPRPTHDQVDFVIAAYGPGEGPVLTRESLHRCGVGDEAITVVTKRTEGAADRNEGFRATDRPIVCHLDAGIEMTSADTLERLLAVMDELEADVVGPKILGVDRTTDSAVPRFDERWRPVRGEQRESARRPPDRVVQAPWLPSAALLVRREVSRAVAGFDEAYRDRIVADADFCLKARRRDFTCVYAGTAAVEGPAWPPLGAVESDFERLRGKWRNYAHLFGDGEPEPVGTR